jgi:NTE family protein
LAGVTKILVELIGDRKFKDLKMPFAVTAVDLNSGRPVVLDSGPVLDAVLATIAVPGVFPAREMGDLLLADGGISNPVPVNVAKDLAPGKPSVAVVLSNISNQSSSYQVPRIPGPSGVISYLSRLRVAQALGVFIHSLEISSHLLTKLRLEIDKPDVIISPDLTGIGLLDRVEVEEIAKLGEEAAEAALSELRKVVGWQYKVSKFIGIPRLRERFNKGDDQ